MVSHGNGFPFQQVKRSSQAADGGIEIVGLAIAKRDTYIRFISRLAYEQGLLKGDLNAVRSRLLAFKMSEDTQDGVTEIKRNDSMFRVLIQAISPEYYKALEEHENRQEMLAEQEAMDWSADPKTFQESLKQLGGLQSILKGAKGKGLVADGEYI